MDGDGVKAAGDAPTEVYGRRLAELQARQAQEQRQEKRFGYAKLALGCAAIVLAAVFMRRPLMLTWLAAPAAAFVVLAVFHERLLRRLRRRARAVEFFERGMARLSERWQGSGETGERFLDAMHPYARDLDIFGRASLFELLCTVRTRAGEETLARWLIAPADGKEVRARQAAVAELKGRLDFHEELFALGETVRMGVHPASLGEWGESRPVLRRKSVRVIASLLALLWVAGVVGAFFGWIAPLVLMSILNLGYAHHLHSRLDASADAVEAAAKDLSLLAGVLGLIERERFVSPKLAGLQTALRRDGVAPSEAVRRLARLVEFLESRRNPYARFLDLFTFWTAQVVFRAEAWQQEFGPAIRGWLDAVGEVEALTALAGFAWERPEYVFPELVDSEPVSEKRGALFDGEGFAHPLLPAGGVVANDLVLDGGRRLMILSGPNMAGKSTFIRSIGVNAVLAQCGAPVRAKRLKLSPLAVAASICILDSLNGGTSRFYAEIRRVKVISDLCDGPVPVLFLLDELLSGTNSHDRLAGTKLVVTSLMERGAAGIVSTHDLALTAIPETIGDGAFNCHFDDRLVEGELVFDYTLKPGIVQTSNALELMREIGLG